MGFFGSPSRGVYAAWTVFTGGVFGSWQYASVVLVIEFEWWACK